MRVSIVIPAWNLWQMTATCLRSLAECSAGEDMQVVVVDNGSTDATATELDNLGQCLWGKDFLPIHLPENRGFARACNAGARAADGGSVLFLNNDTTLTPGWLAPLRQALAAPQTGAVGPLLLYPDGTAQHCGIVFSPLLWVSHLYEHFPGNHPLLRKKRPLQAITGAALMLARPVFLDCGGFHEGYVNGCEDMDLCFALRQKGLRLAVAGESVVCHHTSQTPGRFDHNNENASLLHQRWGQVAHSDLHLLAQMDGYVASLTQDLGCRLEVPPARAAELAAAAEARADRLDALRELLIAEPLWPAGWLALIDCLEGQGQAEEALKVAAQAMRFYPDRDVQGCVLRLLRRLDQREELARTLALYQADWEDMAHIAFRHQLLVQKKRREAFASGDKVLGGMFADWLEKFGKAAP